MRDLPILLSAPMVRAILDGRKTVTRRIMKPRPFADGYYQGTVCLDVSGPFARFSVEAVGGGAFCTEERASPYGDPGDRLWVREAWRVPDSLDACSGFDIAEKCIEAGYRKPWAPIRYEADGALSSAKDWHDFGTTPGEATPGRYRHSRFMPRWASRLTLNVTDVRVERLQDITHEQALAEAIDRVRDNFGNGPAYCDYRLPMRDTAEWFNHPVPSFRSLWESINGTDSWADNPWVWVVEFRRIEGGAR